MLICGLDEAGRGPLAGPLVAAAFVMPAHLEIQARDGKTLSTNMRRRWAEGLRQQEGVRHYLAVIEVEELNAIGIGAANRAIFERLICQVREDVGQFIVDGNLKLDQAALGERAARTECMVRADQQIPAVSAASILAKVYRDDLMQRLHEDYPIYGWNRNKGYGTAQHISAIRQHGRSPQHRYRFTDTVEQKSYRFLALTVPEKQ